MARTLGKEWQPTNQAAETLGLTPRQLRALLSTLKAGKHYRVTNPNAARHVYLWHVDRIESLLVPITGRKKPEKLQSESLAGHGKDETRIQQDFFTNS